jgi:hypothetical protein
MSEGYATKGGFTTGFIRRSRTLRPGTGSSTSSRAKRRQGEHPVQMISPSARGKLYDDRGNRMGASHATKGGRRWRNYVSRGAVGTQAGLRIGGPRPASEIEIRVANAVGARSARATTARQGCSHETDAQAPQETRLRARSAVSDRLRSYAAAMSEMGLSARYEQGLRRNWLRIRIARRDGSARCSGSIARITSKFLSPAQPPTTLSSPTPSHVS